MAQAQSVALGASVRGQIATTADEDWFSLTIPAPGALTLTLSKVTANDSLSIGQIRDAQGNILGASNGIAAYRSETTSSLVIGVSVGTYYVRLSSFGYSVGSYRFTAGLAATSLQFESEPNPSQNQASVLASGALTRGNIATATDEDWYAVNVSESGTFTLTLSRVGADDNLPPAQLRDSKGNVVASSTGIPSYMDTMAQTLEAGVSAGTYYLRVYPLSYAVGSYLLRATFPAVASIVQPPHTAGGYTVVSPIFTGTGGTTSYLRLINRTSTSETTDVTVKGSPSGRTYGTAQFAVPVRTALQYSIADILSAASANSLTGGDDRYVLYLHSTSGGAFQHILYNSSSAFFENASVCTYAPNADYSGTNQIVTNVHTSALVGFPSEIHVHNFSDTPTTYSVLVTDARTGAAIGTVTLNMAAGASAMYPFAYFQSQLKWTPTAIQPHANLYFSAPDGTDFKASIATFVYNQSIGTYVNMTQVCAIN